MPTSRLRQPSTVDDMLLFRLSQINARAGRRVIRLCEEEFGVTRREWRMLAVLARTDAMLSSKLAEQAGLDRARTSRAVGALVDKRLVARQPRPGDRREVLLRLTDSGRALYAAVLPRIAALNCELLSVLSDQQVAALDAVLCLLQAQAADMSRAGDGTAARGLDDGADRARSARMKG